VSVYFERGRNVTPASNDVKLNTLISSCNFLLLIVSIPLCQ
jgi:hypothetical protein